MASVDIQRLNETGLRMKYWVEILEILGQPELTPFRLTNKEAEPSGAIFAFVPGCKNDSFTALYASFGFYIEDIALFALADSDSSVVTWGSPAAGC